MLPLLASFLAQPLPVADYWLWLAFPICLSVSLTYKTIKAERFGEIFLAAGVLFATMIGGLIAVTIALWLLTRI